MNKTKLIIIIFMLMLTAVLHLDSFNSVNASSTIIEKKFVINANKTSKTIFDSNHSYTKEIKKQSHVYEVNDLKPNKTVYLSLNAKAGYIYEINAALKGSGLKLYYKTEDSDRVPFDFSSEGAFAISFFSTLKEVKKDSTIYILAENESNEEINFTINYNKKKIKY